MSLKKRLFHALEKMSKTDKKSLEKQNTELEEVKEKKSLEEYNKELFRRVGL